MASYQCSRCGSFSLSECSCWIAFDSNQAFPDGPFSDVSVPFAFDNVVPDFPPSQSSSGFPPIFNHLGTLGSYSTAQEYSFYTQNGLYNNQDPSSSLQRHLPSSNPFPGPLTPQLIGTAPVPSMSANLSSMTHAEGPTAPAPNNKRSRKPSGAPHVRQPRKKQKTVSENAPPQPSVSQPPLSIQSRGLGPLSAPPPIEPVLPSQLEVPTTPEGTLGKVVKIYGSVTRTRVARPKSGNTACATDVWFHVCAVPSKERPAILPEDSVLQKIHTTLPKNTPAMACKLCIKKGNWYAIAAQDGQTTTFRKHLHSKHAEEYQQNVINYGLKSSQVKITLKNPAYDNFTFDKFHDKLVSWVVSSDHAMNELDSPELRDLLLYCASAHGVQDKDIPRKAKVTKLIIDKYKEWFAKFKSELANAPGRISLTTDCWTNKALTGFMAVTTHYCTRVQDPGEDTPKLKVNSDLAAFRHVEGSHSGVNLSAKFMRILSELNILHKIGLLTLDNASNNGKMLECIENHLEFIGIRFHREGNRVRCVPHVVNIGVDTGLAVLKDIEELKCALAEAHSPLSQQETEYIKALESDVVGSCRELVTALRASDLRRAALTSAIHEANTAKDFGFDEASGNAIVMPDLQLKKDVPTRWSSILLMIDRYLELSPAIERVIPRFESELRSKTLTEMQNQVLDDIRVLFYLPHRIQELMSFHLTPTLPLAIPAYEHLISGLSAIKQRLPLLVHAIQAMIDKLNNYIVKARGNPAYICAMILNPKMKLEWMKQQWLPDETEKAKEVFQEVMLEYCREVYKTSTPAPSTPFQTPQIPSAPRRAPSMAGTRLSHGFSSFEEITAIVQDPERFAASFNRRKPSLSPESSITSLSSHVAVQEPSPDQIEAANHTTEQNYKDIIEAEFSKYIKAGTTPSDDSGFDLLRFWGNPKTEILYPILYRMALDIMAVQASSVPCERVFSSSKDTDQLQRTKLAPNMMEVLQVLKYSIRKERMDFSMVWKPEEKNNGNEDPTDFKPLDPADFIDTKLEDFDIDHFTVPSSVQNPV